MLTGSQIRMARGYARLSVKGLADLSGVAESTIKRMEMVEGSPSSSGANLEKVQKALEDCGVQFLEKGASAFGPGVASAANKE